jgi:hypothetical protein
VDISLPLDKMSSLDKIAVMEKLWDDLCRDPESIPSPKWHQEVLEAREKEIQLLIGLRKELEIRLNEDRTP